MATILYTTPTPALICDPTKVLVYIGHSALDDGAKAIVLDKSPIEENIHVVRDSAKDRFFAEPRNYNVNDFENTSKKRIQVIAQTDLIGIKYGEGVGEGYELLPNTQLNRTVYDTPVELFHTKGLRSGKTSRMTGNVIQEGNGDKIGELRNIKRIVLKLGYKVFNGSFADNVDRYGQLYYGAWLETAPKGWHRGVDINSTGGASVHNICEGIVVGISSYTMLNVYVPSDNITITYMHHILDDGISLGDTLTNGQKFGTESNQAGGVPMGVHEHVEINLGCNYSTAENMVNQNLTNEQMQRCLNDYYDDKIAVETDEIERLQRIPRALVSEDYIRIRMRNREALITEKNLRNGTTAQRLHDEIHSPGYKDPYYRVELARQEVEANNQTATISSVETGYRQEIGSVGLPSEYPYDYFDKWC